MYRLFHLSASRCRKLAQVRSVIWLGICLAEVRMALLVGSSCHILAEVPAFKSLSTRITYAVEIHMSYMMHVFFGSLCVGFSSSNEQEYAI